jgi:hypothetical protein
MFGEISSIQMVLKLQVWPNIANACVVLLHLGLNS